MTTVRSFKVISLLGGIMAANNSANQGQALFANLTNISNESKTNACHCFACQLAIEFAWPTLQPWPPIGCRINGHGPVTTVFAGLPLPCLLDLLPKILDSIRRHSIGPGAVLANFA